MVVQDCCRKMLLTFTVLHLVPMIWAWKIHLVDPKPAIPHSHPWMVSLLKYGEHYCGASLLRVPCLTNASNIVMTAAHCLPDNFVKSCTVSKEPISSRGVIAGEHNRLRNDDGEEKRTAINFVCHPQYPTQYFGNAANDVALIKLDKPIDFSTIIQPVDLPGQNEVPSSDLNCILAGWGTEKDPGGTLPESLQELPVSLESPYCKQSDDSFDEKISVCVTRRDPPVNGGTACQHDSGSPVVCQKGNGWVQYGIVSGSLSNVPNGEENRCISATRSTRVSMYVDWIKETVKTLGCENRYADAQDAKMAYK